MDETTSTMQDFNFNVSYVLIVFNCKTHNNLETPSISLLKIIIMSSKLLVWHSI